MTQKQAECVAGWPDMIDRKFLSDDGLTENEIEELMEEFSNEDDLIPLSAELLTHPIISAKHDLARSVLLPKDLRQEMREACNAGWHLCHTADHDLELVFQEIASTWRGVLSRRFKARVKEFERAVAEKFLLLRTETDDRQAERAVRDDGTPAGYIRRYSLGNVAFDVREDAPNTHFASDVLRMAGLACGEGLVSGQTCTTARGARAVLRVRHPDGQIVLYEVNVEPLGPADTTIIHYGESATKDDDAAVADGPIL